ncbi:MAG: hypothetical protein ACXVAB_05510 [Thermodesulfobacteriota bacterium]
MKKMICLLVIALMIVSVAFAAAKKITPKDLAGLKGTWEGMWDLGLTGSAPCKLEILNDAVPVHIKLTVHNIPDSVASQLGILGGTIVYESYDGVITSQGTLMWTGSQDNFLEISMGEKRLSGPYSFRSAKGYVSLKKK